MTSCLSQGQADLLTYAKAEVEENMKQVHDAALTGNLARESRGVTRARSQSRKSQHDNANACDERWGTWPDCCPRHYNLPPRKHPFNVWYCAPFTSSLRGSLVIIFVKTAEYFWDLFRCAIHFKGGIWAHKIHPMGYLEVGPDQDWAIYDPVVSLSTVSVSLLVPLNLNQNIFIYSLVSSW